MDALAKAAAVFAVAMIALCPVALAADSEASGSLDGLMLYEVSYDDVKGVAVHNYGSSSVDLSDYSIADRTGTSGSEGTLTFSSFTVAAGATIVFVEEMQTGYAFCEQSGAETYVYGDNGASWITMTGSFNPAAGGDDVYLSRNGTIVDAVFYGSKESTGTYWSGDSFDVDGGAFIIRTGSTDTDTAADWSVYGRTNLTFDASIQYSATVTPFLFPESGGIPVYQAIESATSNIKVNLYMLSSANMLSLLCMKAAEGVDVDILLEGAPLGYTSYISNIATYLATIESQGGEVRFIGGTVNDRYDYDHAKYAIIDGDTVVVTSENWTAANVNGTLDSTPYDSDTEGNRGWGVVVESTQYAAYMDAVFETDWSTEYGDVTLFSDKYPNANTRTYTYTEPEEATFASYSATVTPVLSSDSSYDALEYYVSNATTRAYSEQQSLSDSYVDTTDDSPLNLFSAAALRGVDSRLIFGTANVETETVLDINMTTSIKAASMSTPTLHNKGVICDDSAMVSSVNWTPTSFGSNREVAVMIHSADVADYFAESFLADFDRYYTYEGFDVTLSGLNSTYDSGAEIVVYATVPQDIYTFVWDLGDGSDPITTTEAFVVAKPADGTHTLTLTVTNSEGLVETVTATYTVGGSSSTSGTDLSSLFGSLGQYAYVIIGALLVIIAAVATALGKGSKGKKRRS